MKPAKLKVLERLFGDAIAGSQVSQFKSKFLAELEREGLVEHVELVLTGRFPVHVKGWVLTIKGHMVYCQSC